MFDVREPRRKRQYRPRWRSWVHKPGVYTKSQRLLGRRMVALALSKANRILLARAFAHVPRLDLGIDCILEGQMGKAFADVEEGGSAFAVQAGPFLYLAGDHTSPAARKMIEELAPGNFLMLSQPGFLEAAKELFGDKLEPVRRVRYSAEWIAREHLDQLERHSRHRAEVARMDLRFVSRIWGQNPFIDLSEFDAPQDFLERGIGFQLSRGEKILAVAFSSLVCSTGIEVSIFVRPDYRRQGIATVLACRLLQWCLEHGTEPHWDAANPESCRLAEKLGYMPAEEYTAYYLIA